MASLVAERDVDAVGNGLRAWLGEHPGLVAGAGVEELERPSVGWSAETLVVHLTGGARVVLRLPPLGTGLFPTYDLHAQSAVQRALAEAGLPVPAPIAYEPDVRWLGAPFLLTPFVDGHIPGQSTVADPWISEATTDEQRAVCAELLDTLAAIHRFDVHGSGVAGVVRAGSLDDELTFWDGYLGWAFDGAPPAPLVASLAWCRDHRPSDEPPSALLWGDARLGNVIFGDDRRARAVLDWEMATIGPPEMDLAWFVALEGAQRRFMGAPPGFPGRDEMISHYESSTGRAVSDFDWYETFALVRSNAVMLRIGALFEAAGGQSFPIDGNPMITLVEERIAAS